MDKEELKQRSEKINKLIGKMKKQAAAKPEDVAKSWRLLRNIIAGYGPGALAYVGLPLASGHLGGRLYSKLTSPSEQELHQIQAKYVKEKLEQAISDLEKKKKAQQLEERTTGDGATLRF